MGTFGTQRNETPTGTTRRLRDLAAPREGQCPPPPPKPVSPAIARPDETDPSGEPDAFERKSKGNRPGLADLAGVREGDRSVLAVRSKRDLPRITFQPIHALIAILTLTCALCASLTMLIQQAVHYSELQHARAAHSSSQTVPQESERSQSNSQSQELPSESETDSAQPSSDPTNGLVDINSADSEELQTLKGVGPAIAQRIIDYRAQIGRFDSVDQLLEVSGIGTKTLSKFKDQVCVR